MNSSNGRFSHFHPAYPPNGNGSSSNNGANGYHANGQHETAPGIETGLLDPPSQARANVESPEVSSNEETYDAHFEGLVTQILTRIGETPERDGLQRTPLRMAKALDYLTSGYTANLEQIVNGAIFEDDGEEMILVRDIEFYSLCEHHMLPFFGRVHIAYIPDGKIIGLSKLARVADVFARRLQVQERLTNQIADAIEELLTPRGVAVVAEASHFCMMMRGVQKQNSSTLTSAMRGVFKNDPQQRDQFMRMIG